MTRGDCIPLTLVFALQSQCIQRQSSILPILHAYSLVLMKFSFFTDLKLEKHIKSEHFNENGSAQCNECKVKRSNYKLLVKHKKLKHKVKKIKKLKLVNKVKIEDEENCKLCDVSVEKCQIYDHYKENHGGIPVKIGGNDLIECIKCAPSNSNPVFVESVEQLLKHIEEFHKGCLISENISL